MIYIFYNSFTYVNILFSYIYLAYTLDVICISCIIYSSFIYMCVCLYIYVYIRMFYFPSPCLLSNVCGYVCVCAHTWICSYKNIVASLRRGFGGASESGGKAGRKGEHLRWREQQGRALRRETPGVL